MKFRRPSFIRTPRSAGPPPGLHSYTRETGGERTRLHLRVDTNGSGLLLINANRTLHLNATATAMAWMILEGVQEPDAVAKLHKTFKVSASTVQSDFKSVASQINELIRPNGACPVHDLELDVLPPFSQIPDAPYRMDLALTYRCNCDCAHCYNARPRTYPEMSAENWRLVLDKLWETGIPHVCFTGGEATLRSDLPELIRYAQDLGQITGLLTNGRRLSDPAYVASLSEAGLDHVQITLESHDPQVHDRMVGASGAWRQTTRGIENALASGMFVMTNTTLLADNAPDIEHTVSFLSDMGVPTVGINALIHAGSGRAVGTGLHEGDLGPLLERVRDQTERNRQRLIWYTPTQYCHFDPVQMDLGVKGCTAAMYNMCIEPDGSVIPCQSYYQTLGNVLTDEWSVIWNHELSVWLRERQYLPEACNECPVLNECGGGCPLSLAHLQPAGLYSEVE